MKSSSNIWLRGCDTLRWITALATLSITVSAGSLQSQTLPLKIHPNNRYLTDQNGRPVFFNADAGWSLMVQTTYAEANTYLVDRASRGFNAIIVELIEHMFSSDPPNNRNGDPPFTGAPFATPNEPYFAHCDSVLSRALELRMTVLLDPVYLGYNCGNEGWCSEIAAAGIDTMKSWGLYLGNRYKYYPNIIWIIGGDTDPTPVQEKLDSVVAGLRAVDTVYANRIITTHNEPESQAITHWPGRSWLTLNSIYTHSSTLYSEADAAYDVTPTIPFILIESVYENEHSSTPQSLRAQAYWTSLRGGCGHIFGNCPIWHFGYSSTWCGLSDWVTQLGGPGSVSMSHFASLFNSRNWYRLVPDRTGSVIIGGAQSGTTFATVAYATDSSSILGYLPTERTVTIDPSVLKGDSIRVWWYNPSTGAATDSGSFSNSTRSYNPPAAGDWVMVIDSKQFRFNRPGNPAPTHVSPPNSSTGQDVNPVLLWNSSLADTYDVQVSDDSAFSSTTFEDSLLVDTTRQVFGLSGGSTYYWRVRSRSVAGVTDWSDAWSFTTIVAPAAPVVLSPPDTGVIYADTVVFTWQPSAPAVTNYWFELSTDSLFAGGFIDSTVTDTTTVVRQLLQSQRYWWRVRARNAAGWGLFSQQRRFMTLLPPSMPILSSPSNGATNQPDSLILTWYSSGGALSYLCQVATDSGFALLVVDDSTVVDTARAVTSLSPGTTYHWHVRARNAAGASGWSEPWSFSTIVSLPGQVQLVFPSDTGTINADTVAFVWHPTSPAVTSYWFELSNDSLFAGAFIDSTITDTLTVIRQLLQNQWYWWRVRAHNVAGWGLFSEQRRFIIILAGLRSMYDVPVSSEVSLNYPNPFNPTTRIRYQLAKQSRVIIRIYNVVGQEVRTLVDAEQLPGYYSLVWDAADNSGHGVSSGTYFCSAQLGDAMEIRKMVLLK